MSSMDSLETFLTTISVLSGDGYLDGHDAIARVVGDFYDRDFNAARSTRNGPSALAPSVRRDNGNVMRETIKIKISMEDGSFLRSSKDELDRLHREGVLGKACMELHPIEGVPGSGLIGVDMGGPFQQWLATAASRLLNNLALFLPATWGEDEGSLRALRVNPVPSVCCRSLTADDGPDALWIKQVCFLRW